MGLRLRVGARGSRLSQTQTSLVSSLLKQSLGEELVLDLVQVRTQGDRSPNVKSRGEAGAKGAFTGDLESMLIKGDIDVAVHSMKDLPSEETDGLAIGATPKRADPRDALVTRTGGPLATLPRGAKVGTGSLRRRAQLLAMRPDIEVVDLHGNVDTRLRRLEGSTSNGLHGVVLAAAGLSRLGEDSRISQLFTVDEMVPAVGQGIIAVQMRRRDTDVRNALSKIDDEPTRVESLAERALARRLGADCSVPVGGCARVEGSEVKLVGMVAEQDGSALRRRSLSGPLGDAVSLGESLADSLLAMAPSRRTEA